MDFSHPPIDLRSLIKRPDGKPNSAPAWMEPPPRPKLEKIQPRDVKPPEQTVAVSVLRAHLFLNEWRELGAEYVTSLSDAQRKVAISFVRLIGVLPSSNDWCRVAVPAPEEPPEPPADPEADGWKKTVELQSCCVGGMAGNHVVAAIGETWKSTLRDAARSVASNRARVISELTARDLHYLDRAQRDPSAHY
jgi:hypothetical protein